MKYKRYIPAFRPEEVWRQTTINLHYLNAFFEAKEQCEKLGKSVPIKGYGGWHIHPVKELQDE